MSTKGAGAHQSLADSVQYLYLAELGQFMQTQITTCISIIYTYLLYTNFPDATHWIKKGGASCPVLSALTHTDTPPK